MSARILAINGQKRTIWHDVDDDTAVVETQEDCAPVIARVRSLTEAQPDRHDGMRLEAVIPAHVLSRAFTEGWFHDDEAWRRWANDPANRAFRVEHHGRVKQL